MNLLKTKAIQGKLMATTKQTIAQLISEQLAVLNQTTYQQYFQLLGATLRQRTDEPSKFTVIVLMRTDRETGNIFYNIARSFKSHIEVRNGIPCTVDYVKMVYKKEGLYALLINLNVDMESDQQGGDTGGSIAVNRLLNIIEVNSDDSLVDIKELEFESLTESTAITITKMMLEETAVEAEAEQAANDEEAQFEALEIRPRYR
ncbi:MAG: hypothetical protein CL840_03320 [Crocinitomicaceae bacterium]|nr:hypothetical protein [Crocinitomicaceae bacterium]|tara:strand:- start:341545 stop:342153 length:609 start_codon:yes stop_codon:yes gene_type:complete